ncbi:MAG TPA: TonB-dependent receptor [Polyangiaceae bacterium]|nr:TonB-dependent receptor [Polyangiaceae bacterium]
MATRILTTLLRATLLVACLGIPENAFAQANASGETPGRQPKLTKLPKLVHFEEAEYPESEKAAGRAASVVLQIAIDDKGAVQDAAVLQSAGAAFDTAALAAVKKFTFDPAEIDNKPAPVKITYRYDFVFKVEPPQPVINYDGEIRNRFSKAPIAGVKVSVDGGSEVVTDENGHFEFKEVPLGKHVISISGPGLTPVTTEEELVKGQKLSVKYALEPKEEGEEAEASDLEIVVVAPKIHKEVVSTEIKTEEGRRVPGTQGDTLKVVQNLPGVARASFGSGALVVWGAAPQDTRVYVDGIHIPLLYHGGGVRSIMTSDLVRAINLAPGGYGADYGRGLGGLVTVDTRALRSNGAHGFVAADAIDAGAMVEAPINNSTRIAIAGRKSYLDRTLSAFTSKDVSDFIPIPDYYDVQVKITHDLGANESIDVLALASRDQLTRTLPNEDPAEVKSDYSLTAFTRLGVTYRRQFADGSTVLVTPWAGFDHTNTEASFGGTPTQLDIESKVYGFRSAWRGRTTQAMVTTVGLDVEGSRSSLQRVGSVTLPAREGDITVFGQPPGDQVNADNWQTTILSVAPYVQTDIALDEDRIHIVPGLRVEPFVTSASRRLPVQGEIPSTGVTNQTTTVEPRLSASYQVLPRLAFKAAAGLYHQSPQPADLSAVFGNPTLGIEHSKHLLGGSTFKFSEQISLEEVLFYSASSDLVTRSEAPTPINAQALVQEGQGRAYGLQLLLRHELAGRFFGWVSYTLMRSERKDHDDLAWRLFDFDQTHVATVVGSYDLGAGFEFGARFRYATGFPRTPVIGALVSGRRDLYEPIFGPQNSTRIPAFVQLDLRLAKRFTMSWGKAEIYLDVQNVTDRSNPEEVVYDYRYAQKSYITGLPTLPVLGARLEF